MTNKNAQDERECDSDYVKGLNAGYKKGRSEVLKEVEAFIDSLECHIWLNEWWINHKELKQQIAKLKDETQ
jgi:hypothetical protein